MRKWLSVFVSIIVLFGCFTVTALAEDNVKVVLNGEQLQFDVPAQLINGRTMVPMRAIFEALGAKVDWDAQTQTAYGSKMGILIKITINSNVLYKNYHEFTLDTPAQLIDGRTLVPVRAISESFGIKVDWDDATRTVILTDRNLLQSVRISEHMLFEGETLDGTPFGFGTMYIKNDEVQSIEIGRWEGTELKYGLSDVVWSDGARYIGFCQNNKWNGYGEFYYPDGSVYKGDYLNGVKNGYGEYYWANGNYYKGEFSNGVPHGSGVVYDAQNGVCRDVIYENGTIISPDNDVPVTTANGLTLAHFSSARFPLYLYSYDGKTYLGKLTINRYDSESIMNKYGTYGSKYSQSSIWNEYGIYGSQYNNQSAFNPYATNPPIIVDSNNNIIGYLTNNAANPKGITVLELMRILTTLNR